MIRLLSGLLALFAFICASPHVAAQDLFLVDAQRLTICPAMEEESAPPDFDAPSCRKVSPEEVDPQNRMIWLRGYVSVPDQMLAAPTPLGLVVAGVGARDVYLNGRYLGADGNPAANADDEIPGRMDSIFYLPREVVRSGENEVVLRLSAHHGHVDLVYPVHLIGIGTYVQMHDFLLRHYWPSLLTFGVFAIGFFYFGAMSVLGRDRAGSLLLTLISFFAGAQLLTEVYRGLAAYPYPVHDLRLALIVLFSFGFGFCLAAHVAARFFENRRAVVIAIAVCVIATLAAIALAPGFDGKAAAAVFTPTILSAFLALWRTVQQRRGAWRYLAALGAFAAVILIFAGQFLDTVFFFAVAGLLAFLFTQQALTLAREEERRRSEEARARRLEEALKEARRENGDSRLKIKNGGKVEFVAPEQISHCNGAGDYVSLCFHEGGETLHSGSLNELEKDLPSAFLRVHRSHIVNTKLVKSLAREAGGVGRLEMQNGASVPVSRRIMPKVRSVLE